MANYNTDLVTVIVDGFIVTGFADGTYISCGRNEDKREFEVGAQGDVVVVENADDTGFFNFTLQQTSPANSVLRALFKSGASFAVSVNDPNDNSASSFASECYVANLPDNEKEEGSGDREWEILAADYEEI
ncbi:phage structural protein [Natroniella sp. ANB-PHB2]|uniref:phage structural protein n=1 Tax=Natroniella sp. ANB-PHB2 TaxID=3384444 RepID=UPI0038D3B299